jgi:hypothetical protein
VGPTGERYSGPSTSMKESYLLARPVSTHRA